jgi:hypothetical protein
MKLKFAFNVLFDSTQRCRHTHTMMEQLETRLGQSKPAQVGETTMSSMTQASSRRARYGASCLGYRKRKQRCDAQTPTCSRCLRLKEQCL